MLTGFNLSLKSSIFLACIQVSIPLAFPESLRGCQKGLAR